MKTPRPERAQARTREDRSVKVDTTAQSSNVTVYTTSASLSYDMLDDFDRRFASLMSDIAGIERRLDKVSDKLRS